MTNHEFLAFLDAAFKHYGGWPHPSVIFKDLRFNTPAGQARWDRQARSIMDRLLRRGLIVKVPCHEAGKGKSPAPQECGRSHIALTELGKAQLKTWNELGCGIHTHSAQCHARSMVRDDLDGENLEVWEKKSS